MNGITTDVSQPQTAVAQPARRFNLSRKAARRAEAERMVRRTTFADAAAVHAFCEANKVPPDVLFRHCVDAADNAIIAQREADAYRARTGRPLRFAGPSVARPISPRTLAPGDEIPYTVALDTPQPADVAFTAAMLLGMAQRFGSRRRPGARPSGERGARVAA